MLIECVGVGWVQRASLFVRWWSWSGTLNLCALLPSHYLGSYELVTRWVTWRGRKDAHRRCVQRTLEALRISSPPPTTSKCGQQVLQAG